MKHFPSLKNGKFQIQEHGTSPLPLTQDSVVYSSPSLSCKQNNTHSRIMKSLKRMQNATENAKEIRDEYKATLAEIMELRGSNAVS